MKNWKDRITINPNISHGRPCIKGTRVWVSLIVDNFAIFVKILFYSQIHFLITF